MRLKSLAKEYWPFIMPILVLLPGFTAFPFPGSGATFSDLAVTHYPNAVFLRQALLDGTVPLWNPSILSGYPFIAHPYSGIWYPPYWMALLFPLPFGLNLLTALHLVWAGIGMHALLRQSDLNRPAAILGGLAFSATPKLFAHIGAGHLMLVMAVCWSPWLLWSANRKPGTNRAGRYVSPAVILAIIFLIDPRWALYAGLLLAGWWVAYSQRENISKRAVAFIKQIGLALLLVFPATWLFLEYAQCSTRSELTAAEVLELSLPLTTFLGLIIPQWGGFHEWVVYPGIAVLALAVISFFGKKFDPKTIFWSVVLLLAVIISLGENILGSGYLAGLPIFNQLRIPPRSMFLAAMSFAALAALGFQFLLDQKKAARTPRFVFVSLIALTLMFSGIAAINASPIWQPSLFATGLLTAFWLAYEQFLARRISARSLVLLTCAILIIDLGMADTGLIRFRSANSVLSENQEIVEFLKEQPGQFRVYSPSYSLAQQTASASQLELANGVDPLQLEAYAQFMESASGVPRGGYSVSLPPFAGTLEIFKANVAFAPDPELLGLLNVKFVVSDFPIEAAELVKVVVSGDSYVYENNAAQPRAWVKSDDAHFLPITEMVWDYNRIRIRASGPGRLVLSEVIYPGWIAKVDGQKTGIEEDAGVLRSVMLSPGEHEIVFEFAPLALPVGLLISLTTVVALGLWPTSKRRS